MANPVDEHISTIIVCSTIAVVVATLVIGIVFLNRQSNAYWGPIVLACTQDGGTMVQNACYGARK